MKVLVMYKPDTYFDWVGAISRNNLLHTKKEFGNCYRFIRNYYPEFALQNNLVDIKVFVASNDWSGLKLVVPVTKR